MKIKTFTLLCVMSLMSNRIYCHGRAGVEFVDGSTRLGSDLKACFQEENLKLSAEEVTAINKILDCGARLHTANQEFEDAIKGLSKEKKESISAGRACHMSKAIDSNRLLDQKAQKEELDRHNKLMREFPLSHRDFKRFPTGRKFQDISKSLEKKNQALMKIASDSTKKIIAGKLAECQILGNLIYTFGPADQ